MPTANFRASDLMENGVKWFTEATPDGGNWCQRLETPNYTSIGVAANYSPEQALHLGLDDHIRGYDLARSNFTEDTRLA
jgi:hypothetical protein